MLDSANVEPKLRITAQGDGFGPSDHSSFYAKGIPVLHFFTDLHEDYHRATDDVEKIDAAGWRASLASPSVSCAPSPTGPTV